MKIYLPWFNLGCLGIRIGNHYADVFRTWSGRIGIFYTDGVKRVYKWL